MDVKFVNFGTSGFLINKSMNYSGQIFKKLTSHKTPKPWGYEFIFIKTDNYVGKVLHVIKGHRLSLQYHDVKEETLYVIEGQCEILLDKKWHFLSEGSYIHIEPKTIHRIKAVTDCDIVEVSTPQLDDIVRLEDDYGRL